jgi:hypothetical protein
VVFAFVVFAFVVFAFVVFAFVVIEVLVVAFVFDVARAAFAGKIVALPTLGEKMLSWPSDQRTR